jgi:hypothetical protein
MTTVKLTVDPHQTPEEEAQLVARVAAAVAESTGAEVVSFELERSEHVRVSGGVGERMARGARWSA